MIGNLEVLVTRNEYLLWDYNLFGFLLQNPAERGVGATAHGRDHMNSVLDASDSVAIASQCDFFLCTLTYKPNEML